MKVTIAKARRHTYWYSDHIGETFEVLDKIYINSIGEKVYRLKSSPTCLIDINDVKEKLWSMS